MSQQNNKLKKLEEALDLEYDKVGNGRRFTARYRMLELQRDIEFAKDCLKFHEDLAGENESGWKEETKRLNTEIIDLYKKDLKKLLKQAQEI